MSAVLIRVVLIRSVFCLWLGLAALPLALYAADPIGWDSGTQGGYITCLCADLTGHVWMGTEDNGVWRYDFEAPPGLRWRHFTRKNGLGDDTAYALICDKYGRVWVGTLNHGVSVYTGSEWRNFSPPDGPLGARVFALAASPVDGDVWIATECGLTRFSLHQQTWTDYTEQNGLPPGGPTALAFSKDGTLYVGTQCDGLAVGTAKDDFKTWRLVPGPAQRPTTPSGGGLPSGMVNCLLVARDGTVYAGTTGGLARSRDDGQTWQYVRGADWRENVTGQWHGPLPQEHGPFPATLTEDYVTTLAEDAVGRLLIGHRQTGLEMWNPKTQARVLLDSSNPNPDDVTSLLTWWDGTDLAGGYGTGLAQIVPPDPNPFVPARIDLPDWGGVPRLPPPAAPPTLAQLNAFTAQVMSVPPNPHETEPGVIALPDDWRTEGNWLGRYGRYWACLAAFFHPIPEDYIWGAGWEPISYAVTMGSNHDGSDSLRYWLESRYTDDPRVLEMPMAYLHSRVLKGYTTWKQNRRETEWDDHGESYFQSRDGPNIYATVTVPDGLFYLSLYNFNKDGHWGLPRFRDYRLSMRAHAGTSLDDVGAFDTQPELAYGRIRDFWGGVWKRFLVRGPLTLTIEVNRNHSMNATLPAVMLDLVDEDPPPYFQTVGQWQTREVRRERMRQERMAHPVRFCPAVSEAEAACQLFTALAEKRLTNSRWWATEGRRGYVLLQRWYSAAARSSAPNQRKDLDADLAACFYQLGAYSDWENHQQALGLVTARQRETSLRWDGVTNSYSGLGYAVMTAHLAEQASRKIRLPK